MRLRTIKRLKNPSYTQLFLVGAALYVALFVAGFFIIKASIPKATGQYSPGQTYAGESLKDSLDLKLAAQVKYDSSAISIVKNLSDQGGVAEKIFSYKVPIDGLTEYGLMMMPSAKAPQKGYPAIILCHGYINPARYSTKFGYIRDMEFYASHGFVVVKPDFRGQGLTAHQGTPDSAYYSMAYNKDVMSLITALQKTGYIDKSNINLWGHSMGAYIALRAAVLSPDIKNLILLSTPGDSLSKMYLTYIPSSDENNTYALKTRAEAFTKYGTPAENNSFWKNASPINFVSRIKAHIQINVGALDQIVPPEFSADLDKALTNRHIKHDYYLYADGSHSLADQRGLIWSRSLSVLQPKASS